MKQVVVIILTLSIFLQSTSKVWVYVSFKINQESIAKTLCLQKEVKRNCCQGSCHLKKELAKTDDQQNTPVPIAAKKNVELQFCSQKIAPFTASQMVQMEEQDWGIQQMNFALSEFTTSVFHPPQFA